MTAILGVVERANTSEIVRTLRTRLYETGTNGIRAILEAHLDPASVEPSLAMLTGAVFVRVTFEGSPATRSFTDDVIGRVIGAN